MYKTNFVCTYKKFEEMADDEVNSDMLYQAQFLQVFGLLEYNDIAINASLELINKQMNKVPELKLLILQHPYGRTTDSIDILLPLMFSYPLMDVFHLCLIDVFKTGSISTVSRDKVLDIYETLK